MSNNKLPISFSGDLSLASVLFLTFLVLKLTNVIDWSWWWVTSPLWIPITLAIIVCIPFMVLIKRNKLTTDTEKLLKKIYNTDLKS